MMVSLTKIAKRKSVAILVLALLLQLFPSVALPGSGIPEAYAESSVTDSTYSTLNLALRTACITYCNPIISLTEMSDIRLIFPSELTRMSIRRRMRNGKSYLVLAGGEGYVSFESVNMPGYYITDNNFLAKLEQNDGTDRFKAAATFKQVRWLSGKHSGFLSILQRSWTIPQAFELRSANRPDQHPDRQNGRHFSGSVWFRG